MVNVYLQYGNGKPIPLREIDHLELVTLRRDLRAALQNNAPLLQGAMGGDLGYAIQAVEHEYDRRFDEATADYRAKRKQNGAVPPDFCRIVKPGTHGISAAIGTVYVLHPTDKTTIYLFNEQRYEEVPNRRISWYADPLVPIEGETTAGACIETQDERVKPFPGIPDSGGYRVRWVTGYDEVLKVVKPYRKRMSPQCAAILYDPLVERRPFPQVAYPKK